MVKVTVSAITENGVIPNFYGVFRHKFLADEYAADWRKLAAKSGIIIRIDREEV